MKTINNMDFNQIKLLFNPRPRKIILQLLKITITE